MDLTALTRALSLRPSETRLLILTDFDGTLVELAEDPDSVELSSDRRDLIQRLAGRRDLSLGVVSGRQLADLRLRVGAGDGIYYAEDQNEKGVIWKLYFNIILISALGIIHIIIHYL